jgi:hypothetical protein
MVLVSTIPVCCVESSIYERFSKMIDLTSCPSKFSMAATFLVAAVFNELHASHVLTPMLIMEGSTVPLGILRANFLTPSMQMISQGAFVLLFFICRLLIFPIMYFEALPLMTGNCFPSSLYYICLLFGIFFNCLNIFWFVKMLKKIHRKITGKEPLSSVDRE